MIEHFITCLQKYFVFKGRSSREEYWYFILCTVIIGISMTLLSEALGWKIIHSYAFGGPTYPLVELSRLAFFFPSIAAGTRRLHDINRTGWWMFLFFLPIVGWIALIVMHASSSDNNDNQFGPKPNIIVDNIEKG